MIQPFPNGKRPPETPMSLRPTFALAAFAILFAGPALASKTLVVPGNDGYGLSECLSDGQSCGSVVADAWCEANGFGKALSFGRAAADDVTGSVITASTRATDAFIVQCND
jgi:hypothetical protein